MRKLSIVMRSILTVAFVVAGIPKLIGAEMMVEVFAQLGFGQWFRFATGSIEVGAALLLWLQDGRSLEPPCWGNNGWSCACKSADTWYFSHAGHHIGSDMQRCPFPA